MTVCIAGRCKWYDGSRAIVLCADGRLDEGEWGFTDAGKKYHTLGFNFLGLMAGRWRTARELCSRMEARHSNYQSRPKNVEELLDRLDSAASEFCSSRLCEGDPGVLVTGFIEEDPVIVEVKIEERKASVTIKDDYDAIGEGSYAAMTMLKYRGYEPLSITPFRAAYLIYEAKRFSENVASVGPTIQMKFHFPPTSKAGTEFVSGGANQQYRWQDITEDEMCELEDARSRYFIQGVPRDADFRNPHLFPRE